MEFSERYICVYQCLLPHLTASPFTFVPESVQDFIFSLFTFPCPLNCFCQQTLLQFPVIPILSLCPSARVELYPSAYHISALLLYGLPVSLLFPPWKMRNFYLSIQFCLIKGILSGVFTPTHS